MSTPADRDLVRQVTRAVVDRVGKAGPEVVEAVVGEVIAAIVAGGGGGGAPVSARSGPVTTARGSTILPVVGAAPPIETCVACVEQEKARRRNRAILTTTGKNARGIVARITSRIAELGGDIMDISQTLVGDYFTMIIVVDVGAISVSFERFQAEVNGSVTELGCQAMMMHEDVMTSLHRI